jgi:prepilin-type N-terminal cleavage/methylation domain-containing protein
MNMQTNKTHGVTLMELIVVVTIIGVLVGIIMPQYQRSRERSMDKQAQGILSLIRAAQRNYIMMKGNYYDLSCGFFCSAGLSSCDMSAINSNLNLDLVSDGSWCYLLSPNYGGGFIAQLYRNKAGFNRYWTINATINNSVCAGLSGSSCP